MSLRSIIDNHPRRAARFEFPIEASEATVLATTNFERNRAALERQSPRTVLALPETLPELEWLFARDGALSARHIDQRWFNDLSVPRRAAERMIKSLSIIGTTAVMLAPTHACQVRRVLELLPATAAVIVVIPGEQNAGVTIACDDFSDAINAGRLWLAVGPDWADELKAILDANDGLTPPQTMIRVPNLNASVVEHVSRPCDVLLANHGKVQKQLVSMLHAKPRFPQRPVRKVCVVGGAFKLWDDAAQLLGDSAKTSAIPCVAVDASSPLQASDLRLARAVEGCDAIVTANVGRADRAGIVPDNVPWITWVTGTAVPAFVPSAVEDRLVVADATLRELATAAGWPASQVMIASEPWHERLAHERGAHATKIPAIVLDLPAIVLPKSIEEMSSVRLVWELIERELTGRALVARPAVDAFILGCADRVGVPREGFPLAVFRERLVLPLFAREVAVELATRGLKFNLFGDGWAASPALASVWRGPVKTAEAFTAAIGSASALLDLWPTHDSHPARRLGVPTVRTWGKRPADLHSDLRSPAKPSQAGPVLDVAQVFNL